MRLLFVSNLFPNACESTRGLFNAQQVGALAKCCKVVKVIAPLSRKLPPDMYAGIPVTHPHFYHIPLLSRPFNGWLFARAVEPAIEINTFDVALVNWAYPDAYGIMLLSRKFGFPYATTVQGSDVNLLFQNPARKKQILTTLRASCAVFTRSNALRTKLATEGITATTVYNGIDRRRFHSIDRSTACAALNIRSNCRRILYVGNLQPVKGPAILAESFQTLSDIPDLEMVFIGEGPEKAKIANTKRMRLVGAQSHDLIPLWMNACDLLCLPSLHEGLPNVVLEALACGLPVVATNVGGVPEIITAETLGFLVKPASVTELADSLRRALNINWDRMHIAQSASRFDWNENASAVLRVLRQCLPSNPKAEAAR